MDVRDQPLGMQQVLGALNELAEAWRECPSFPPSQRIREGLSNIIRLVNKPSDAPIEIPLAVQQALIEMIDRADQLEKDDLTLLMQAISRLEAVVDRAL